jgi:hypothetical protein
MMYPGLNPLASAPCAVAELCATTPTIPAAATKMRAPQSASARVRYRRLLSVLMECSLPGCQRHPCTEMRNTSPARSTYQWRAVKPGCSAHRRSPSTGRNGGRRLTPIGSCHRARPSVCRSQPPRPPRSRSPPPRPRAPRRSLRPARAKPARGCARQRPSRWGRGLGNPGPPRPRDYLRSAGLRSKGMHRCEQLGMPSPGKMQMPGVTPTRRLEPGRSVKKPPGNLPRCRVPRLQQQQPQW